MNASDKARILSEILQSLLNTCYPEKVITIRDDEDPWITKKIKKIIKKRKKHFKKYGRDSHWHALKKKSDKLIQEAKEECYENGKKKALAANNSSSYYKVVHNVKDGEAPKAFDIRTLRPDLNAVELADDIAAFFNISL